jgi:putative ABC transport system permease protein
VKFLPLVWAGLWRKPVRSILTATCIVIAFVLLGLLEGVNAGFAQAIANAHREFLVTRTRVRGGAPMPIAAISTIQSIPGVEEVASRAYFTGNYRDPGANNAVSAIATDPDIFFRLLIGVRVAPRDVEALRKTRTGMLVTSSLLEYNGWKVGDTITLHSSTLKTDGSSDWTFHILGTFDFAQPAPPAYFGVINYAYLDEYRVTDRGTAETFYVRIADPNRAVAMSAAIDRIFANSAHETRTLSQQARAEAQTKQMGDVEFFTNAIIGVVLFTLTFLTGNTLRQAFQERVREFGVLKTMGYSGGRLLSLAYAEALLLYLPPAAFGLLIARLLAPLAREDIGLIVVSPAVAAVGLLCAACLAFLGAALPALNLARMPIAAALGKG